MEHPAPRRKQARSTATFEKAIHIGATRRTAEAFVNAQLSPIPTQHLSGLPHAFMN